MRYNGNEIPFKQMVQKVKKSRHADSSSKQMKKVKMTLETIFQRSDYKPDLADSFNVQLFYHLIQKPGFWILSPFFWRQWLDTVTLCWMTESIVNSNICFTSYFLGRSSGNRYRSFFSSSFRDSRWRCQCWKCQSTERRKRAFSKEKVISNHRKENLEAMQRPVLFI